MKKSLVTKEFTLGVCYYPEHWPEALWDDDYKRMKSMGFSMIRVAEFAWSIFEPREGEFNFDLFDRAIDLAHANGLKVIIGTPTATPPAWLTHKYPEVLNVTQEGVQYQHGQRRHYNYNSSVYRDYSSKIVKEMALHYKDHPAVVGWQIDNELNCEVNVFYSDADQVAFREWLKEKYSSLENLNHTWGTVFWSQTYTDWEQVHLTRPTPSNSPNPHQALDEKRFFSDSAISYAKLQEAILRELAPNQWITTNGLFGHLDNHKMTDDLLDFISYDSYPNFSTIYPDKGDRPLLDRKWSWNLSNVRSISPNFAVLEQQSGPGGWVNRMEQPSPKPGQMRLWTYQSIAHGADMVLYFRWRTATVGTEIYWHGLNDYHNQPNRRTKEATIIGKELQTIGERIIGSEYQAEIAIVKDYDNEWDGELDNWHGKFEHESQMEWFKALQRNHLPTDTFYVNNNTTVDELKGYKVLVYPHPTILPEKIASVLAEYVENGGTVIFGCRTGYKNEHGHCYMSPFPGTVSELCGITVEDFTLIGPYQDAPKVKWLNSDENIVSSSSFNEVLKVEAKDVKVLATYEEGYYKGKPALVKRQCGEGSVYYYGSVFSETTAVNMISEIGLDSPIVSLMDLPETVELSIRVNKETKEKLIFLLNYSDTEQPIVLKEELEELLSGKKKVGETFIEGYGVLVFSF